MLSKLLGRKREEPSPDATLVSQAYSAIAEYACDNAALFERAERLRAKADRMETDGTPSESANNRADRARMEVEAGLLDLREAFARSAGERRRAFDLEVRRLYPTLGI